MNTLVIDTSTRSTVLGLDYSGEVIDRTTDSKNSHSREILPSIDRLIGDAGISLQQLDAIIFGQGPGSFTGLRIAVGVVQGLGYGLDIPVVPVSSMAALAQACFRKRPAYRHVLVAITARLDEIYYGAYGFESGVAGEIKPEGVCDVRELPEFSDALAGQSWQGAGNGWDLRELIEGSTHLQFKMIDEQCIPGVPDLLAIGQKKIALGDVVAAIDAAPVYLREVVASKPGKPG